MTYEKFIWENNHKYNRKAGKKNSIYGISQKEARKCNTSVFADTHNRAVAKQGGRVGKVRGIFASSELLERILPQYLRNQK